MTKERYSEKYHYPKADNLSFKLYISFEELRQLCIRHNYYTSGNNRDYQVLLTIYDTVPLTPQMVGNLALDIKEHSDTEDSVGEIMRVISYEASVYMLLSE